MVKNDNSLIYLVSENSRMGLKEISYFLKKSPQALKYSISCLEKEGIIQEPYCIFDYSYFGLILFRVYFRLGYVSEKDKKQILKELEQNQHIVSIYELIGEFEIVIEFASPNPSKFNKELKKVIQTFPTLNDYKIALNLVTYIFPAKYLTKRESLFNVFGDKIVGGDRSVENFSPNEMKVMKILLSEPTIRFTKLADVTGINPRTAKSILTSLSQKNIIKGFKHIIDTNKIGITKSRLFLRLHNMNTEKEVLLMEHIHKSPEIVQMHKTVGDWDLELDIESFDKNKVRLVLIQLREQFKEIIERFNIIEFFGYYKRTYLPQSIFEQKSDV